MSKALSVDLRERVVAAIEAGSSCRAAAARFGVGISSAIRWASLKRSAGSVAPGPLGGDRRSGRIEAQAPLLQLFGAQVKLGGAVLTLGVIVMVLLVFVLNYVLTQTAWGRHVYAIGDDPDAAELAGVKVQRTLISVYTISGLICALAGWVLIGRIGSVSPTAGQFANIESITAVVIGGISLFGGRGSILGMLFGALIVGVFALGLRLLGTDPQWTYLLIGLLIIFAVAVDQWIRKVAG